MRKVPDYCDVDIETCCHHHVHTNTAAAALAEDLCYAGGYQIHRDRQISSWDDRCVSTSTSTAFRNTLRYGRCEQIEACRDLLTAACPLCELVEGLMLARMQGWL